MGNQHSSYKKNKSSYSNTTSHTPTYRTDTTYASKRYIQAPAPPRTEEAPSFPEEVPITKDPANRKVKVLIVGSGFAGLSSAIGLARLGYSVTLIDKGSGLSPHGDNISLGANAAKILMRWGLGPDIWARSSKGGWWLMKDSDGNPLREEDLRDFPILFGSPLLQGHRAQFLGVLGVEARALMVNMKLNTTIVDYIDSADQPAVVTKEGEVIYGDMIVVADGIHSPGRNNLQERLGSASPKMVSDHSVYRAAMSATALASDPRCQHLLDGCVRTWLGRDAHVIIYPIDYSRQISFTFVHKQRLGEKPSTDWGDRRDIREVLSLVQGWDPILVRCLGYFRACLNWGITEDAPAANWVTTGGRIVCIGDSVHPLQPTSFQGGSQAIEDGASLALCLSLSSNNVALALRVFQEIRRPRAVKAHELGLQQRKAWHSWVDHKSSKNLALLVDKMYDYDAELSTISQFEHIAQGIDSTFAVPREKRRALLLGLTAASHVPSAQPPSAVPMRTSSTAGSTTGSMSGSTLGSTLGSNSSVLSAPTQASSVRSTASWPNQWQLYDKKLSKPLI